MSGLCEMGTIYETDLLIKAQHGSMHPGGLRLTDRAVRLAGLNAGMRAADIGCGTGTTAAYLTEKHKLDMVGLEISEKLITIGLKAWPDLNLMRWDGKALPFEDSSLDAIFFECTLSLLEDRSSVLAQAGEALKTEGAVMISDIDVKHRSDTDKSSLLTSDALLKELTALGFDIVVHEDHTAALRTYAAALWESSGGDSHNAADGLRALSCGSHRLSELGYMLVIARKT
jgi:SAM-dependent methyltransferase